ncbi:MAG: glutaredoxin 3 [Candidatus Marithrix sp.]|nr:glutaredoxin 3 [Candidatus Marithrix sp.]
MSDVSMYCTQTCPYCNRAEMLLNKKGVQVKKIFVDNNIEKMTNMIEITGRRTVPQIFIGEFHVGGFDDLAELDIEGKLDSLLQ